MRTLLIGSNSEDDGDDKDDASSLESRGQIAIKFELCAFLHRRNLTDMIEAVNNACEEFNTNRERRLASLNHQIHVVRASLDRQYR